MVHLEVRVDLPVGQVHEQRRPGERRDRRRQQAREAHGREPQQHGHAGHDQQLAVGVAEEAGVHRGRRDEHGQPLQVSAGPRRHPSQCEAPEDHARRVALGGPCLHPGPGVPERDGRQQQDGREGEGRAPLDPVEGGDRDQRDRGERGPHQCLEEPELPVEGPGVAAQQSVEEEGGGQVVLAGDEGDGADVDARSAPPPGRPTPARCAPGRPAAHRRAGTGRSCSRRPPAGDGRHRRG